MIHLTNEEEQKLLEITKRVYLETWDIQVKTIYEKILDSQRMRTRRWLKNS